MKQDAVSNIPTDGVWIRRPEALASLLLALVWIGLRGLPIGIGNQGIQLVFLEHLRNPAAFAKDPLLQSLPQFSTWFFHVLAGWVPLEWEWGPVLQTLQVLNTFFLFLAMVLLTRTLFPQTRYPVACLLPLFAVPLQALAETPFPPLVFSHTALGLTLALFSLQLFFRRRLLAGAALLGLLANIHLLTAASTAAIAGLWVLFRLRHFSWKTLAGAAVLFLLCAAPILLKLDGGSGLYDENWLALLRERSAHHVFPSTWWRAGDASWGLFALWIGWASLFYILTPTDTFAPERMVLLLAPALLMGVGVLGSELHPVPLILRAQLFRASLWPLLFVFCAFPAALENLWREGRLRFASRLMCAAIALLFSVPGLRDAQVWLLLAAAILLLLQGQLRPLAALAVGMVCVLTTVSDLHLHTRFWSVLPRVSLPRPAIQAASTDTWIDIQEKTKALTPADAVLLTPPRRNGFRQYSHRAIVGEWRDGTMQFFDPAFAAGWELRMRKTDPERTRGFNADQWLELARELGADHLVLPADAANGLVVLAANQDWVLCKAERIPPPPLPPAPENAIDPDDWLAQERFMLEVVEPNLRQNRTSEVRLRLVDEQGRPLVGAAVSIEQISRNFGIGSALHHFETPAAYPPDFRAPPVHPRELELFKEVFNYSVIGFSGKWVTIEPTEGERSYADLDAYVDWCAKNGIRIEYHFVTGYEPAWMKRKTPVEQQAALVRHAKELIDRYGDRIDTWQIVNERRLQNAAPPLFEIFRTRIPGVKLGVSHCARFYSERSGERRWTDMMRGWDSAEQLTRAGAKVDYFGVHAHRPFGTWWDPRTMYEVLDAYAAKGVRVHITETGISHAGKIEGSVLKGEWNETLQAEYLRRFLTVCYSHPNVDVVNFWGFGPKTWQKDIGLLNEKYEPRPAFETLRTLVNETWKTRLDLRTDREGGLRFRGFHGGYVLQVRDAAGRAGRIELRLPLAADAGPDPQTFRWISAE